jgi:hypothetical protein
MPESIVSNDLASTFWRIIGIKTFGKPVTARASAARLFVHNAVNGRLTQPVAQLVSLPAALGTAGRYEDCDGRSQTVTGPPRFLMSLPQREEVHRAPGA